VTDAPLIKETSPGDAFWDLLADSPEDIYRQGQASVVEQLAWMFGGRAMTALRQDPERAAELFRAAAACLGCKLPVVPAHISKMEVRYP